MNIVKKIPILLLSALLIIGTLPFMSFADDTVDPTTFTDLPNDWSRSALIHAIQNNLLSGYNGKIMPKDNLTRAQMAAILNSAFGAVKKASLVGYTDVPVSKWYYPEIAKALAMGSFVGSNGKMNPDRFITREEVFSVLAKLFDLGEDAQPDLSKFTDGGEVSSWAKPWLSSMIKAGYISGSGGAIKPKAYMTRAEFAALMDNMVKLYIRTPGTYTGTIRGNVMVTSKDVILKDMTIQGDLILGDGVGDGEVTLENVTISGRTIVRGNALLVEGELIDEEDVALGAGGIPGGNTGGNNGGGNGGGVVTPNTSVYGFRLIKGTTTVLVDDITLRDNDRINFQMVSNVYNLGQTDFLSAISDHSDFINRALTLTSDRSGEAYAYTLANRVINHENQSQLKVLNETAALAVFQQIVDNGNATPELVDQMVDILLSYTLDNIVSDLERIYDQPDDLVPDDFTFWYYNGTTLVAQNQLLIKDIRSTFDGIYNSYTIESMVGKQIMMVEFGDESVYLEIVKYQQ